ncbi:hypothetical protein [Mycobacterium uberis]|uniref:hypothetical protein n=1 Tax=Mycobacterium uberis TaxID=2162698 RepID=UPI001FB2FC57|nr:hypothetical protein [Mycobacterium uberis]
MQVDDGPLVADVARVVSRDTRAVVFIGHAQNSTTAALSVDRAGMLCSLLSDRFDDLLLVEDDHCADIAGAPLHILAGSVNRWALAVSV